MQNIYDLSYQDVEGGIVHLGEKPFHAKQIWRGLYRHLYTSWDEFTTLSKPLREQLRSIYRVGVLNEIDSIATQDGNTRKVLFQLPDGNLIESVLLRKNDRATLCVSSQSGCAIGCVFCATGHLGFFRGLSVGEITEQTLFFQRQLEKEGKKLTNIVYMGMGEPFLNYQNTLSSVSILNHKDGINIGARRITISTIGIPERIRAFGDEETQVNLSVSLHAPSDDLRRKLVPLASKHSIDEVLDACRYYISKTGRRVTFEYVLISGMNDQPAHAILLARILGGLTSHVNLIPLNPTDHFSGDAPHPSVVREFGRILLKEGLTLTIRDSQGDEIGAGCGQLAGKQK